MTHLAHPDHGLAAVSDPKSMSFANPVIRVGFAISALIAGLVILSYSFPYHVVLAEAPLILYVVVALAAGSLWAIIPRSVKRTTDTRKTLWAVVLLGLTMRGVMFFSIPVLEDDSYRYLWDGAVTANAIDPYKYAPADADPIPLFDVQDEPEDPQDLTTLKELAEQYAEPHSRINYPYVSTIYPPLTQAAFSLAYVLDPFGLTGWRFVLLATDLITLALLLSLLRAYNRKSLWAVMYWWNPVILAQGFGAGHMDLLVLPFLLAALLLARRKMPARASLALAGAAGVKLWPVLLFPLIARPLLRHPRKLAIVSLAFAAATALILLPQLVHVLGPEAGLNAYASDWRTHAFLFAILEDMVFAPFNESGEVARITVAALMLGITGYLALRFAHDTDHLPLLCASVIGALIFLSPTGYPWYLFWLAPLIAFVPHPGLLCLFALAPLYWLRFQLGDHSILYQWGVVPLAFGIPLLMLGQSVLQRRIDFARDRHYSSFE